jgi:hypothetical protein
MRKVTRTDVPLGELSDQLNLASPVIVLCLFPEQQRRGKEVGVWGRNLGPLVPPPGIHVVALIGSS